MMRLLWICFLSVIVIGGCKESEPLIFLDSPIDLVSATETDFVPEATSEDIEQVKTESPKKFIVQYSIASCVWCKYDREKIFPEWRRRGYSFADYVDETRNPQGIYPRYDIYDVDGNLIKHSGSLSTYKGK